MNLWSRLATAVFMVVRLSVAQTAPPSNSPPAIQTPVVAGQAAPAQSSSLVPPTEQPVAAQPPATAPPPSTAPPAPTVDVKPTGLALTAPEVPEALVPDPVRPASQTPAPVATAAKPSDVTNEKKEKSTAGATDAGSAKPGTAATDSARYILGANDVVSVQVWGDKNLTGTYTIGPDGRMSMSLIRDFKATGYTIPQLEDLITTKLKDFYNEPNVNVQLLRNNSKKYTLVGAVNKPGPYPLLQETTMLDALAMAGGCRDFAKQTKITILRGKKTFQFNNKQVMKGQHMEQNITLEDGDIIIVPGEQ